MKKNAIIFSIIGLSLILVVSCFANFNSNPVFQEESDAVIGDTSNPVEPTIAKDLYSGFSSSCNGAWILERDERVCKSSELYEQKMMGYSYEGEDLLIYVNVIMVENGHGFRLVGMVLGQYHDSLNDSGTTYLYTYQHGENGYEFSSMKLM